MKLNYYTTTELFDDYLTHYTATDKAGRPYGVSGTTGAWYITDILTGCIVGKCLKLNQVNETVAPKEKEIEKLIESEKFNEIIAEIYLAYKITKIRWFHDFIINRN